MFSILTAGDFLRKVQEDYAVLQQDISDSGKAMNCILSAYHIHEWVWAKFLKMKSPLSINGSMLKNINDFKKFIDIECPYFSLVQELANGSKHCIPVHSTDRVAGYGCGPWGIGPFGAPYLLIDLGEDHSSDKRYLVASQILGNVIEFWELFYENNKVS